MPFPNSPIDLLGKYSKTESKIVVDAVKEYAQVNSVTVEVRLGLG